MASTKIIYRKPDDFPAWARAFQMQARFCKLWDFVKPEGRKDWPNLPKPDIPRINSGKYAYKESIRNLEDITSLADLTETGLEAYRIDYMVFSHKLEVQASKERTLFTWMCDTVALEYRQALFDPDKAFAEWYDALREFSCMDI